MKDSTILCLVYYLGRHVNVMDRWSQLTESILIFRQRAPAPIAESCCTWTLIYIQRHQPGIGSKTRSIGKESPLITKLAKLNHELQSQFITTEHRGLGTQQSIDFLNVLRITTNDPDHPIQILGLPGLISHDAQNKANIACVQKMVETEMRKRLPWPAAFKATRNRLKSGKQTILPLIVKDRWAPSALKTAARVS